CSAPSSAGANSRALPPFVPRSAVTDSTVSIRDSPIHGRGVFAVGELPAPTVFLEDLGERIDRREAERREAENSASGAAYILEYDDDAFIDGFLGGNAARHINHSCAPNCAVVREDGQAFILTTKTIPAGHELLIDYAFDKDGEKVLCRCAAPDCRGVLNDA